MKRRLFLYAVLLFYVSFLSGCGYTTRSMISDKYRTVYITPLINKIDITQEGDMGRKFKIYRPGLETQITQSITDKFLWDGNLKPSHKENADLILQGDLIDFERVPLRYSDDGDVQEYRLDLKVNLSMWDTKESKLLWEENAFTGTSHYFTSFYPIASDRQDEGTAVNEAITDLARRIVERTVEQW